MSLVIRSPLPFLRSASSVRFLPGLHNTRRGTTLVSHSLLLIFVDAEQSYSCRSTASPARSTDLALSTVLTLFSSSFFLQVPTLALQAPSSPCAQDLRGGSNPPASHLQHLQLPHLL